ncbi:hypothetical protein [Paenibacillus sp. oral taxon 786]|uniref:hypothetical protein n=1 Tax=Paenibacillus sp. oral taxon 786 TaxID=652715 RepID=UPI000565E66C|nr:hypothetical protein [Paenibacillus sp. oral taxon 786]
MKAFIVRKEDDIVVDQINDLVHLDGRNIVGESMTAYIDNELAYVFVSDSEEIVVGETVPEYLEDLSTRYLKNNQDELMQRLADIELVFSELFSGEGE